MTTHTTLYTATVSEYEQHEEIIGRGADLDELRQELRRQAQRDWQSMSAGQRPTFPMSLSDLEKLPVEPNTEFTDEGDPIIESYRMGTRRYDIGEG